MSVDLDVPGSVFTFDFPAFDIAEEAKDDANCFTKIEQAKWNLQWAATVY